LNLYLRTAVTLNEDSPDGHALIWHRPCHSRRWYYGIGMLPQGAAGKLSG